MRTHDGHAGGRPSFGLRARLAVYFVVIVLVPLTVLLLLFAGQVSTLRRTAAVRTVERSAEGIGGLLAARQDVLGLLASTAAGEDVVRALVAGDAEQVSEELRSVWEATSAAVDFLVAVDGDGRVVADVGRMPTVQPNQPIADAEEIAAAALDRQGVPGAVVAGRTLTGEGGQPVGFVAAGRWLDARRLAEMPDPGVDGGVVTLVDGEMWATSRDTPDLDPATIEPDGTTLSGRTVGDDEIVAARVEQVDLGGSQLLVWDRTRSFFNVPRALLFTVPPALGLAALLGWFLAGTVVAPVRRASEVASAIANGDLERRVPEVGGGRELEELAAALNTTSQRLADRIAELERHRDELRASLSRLGETLSSSLDLDRTLSVVTETAMDMLRADRSILMLLTPERDGLYAKVGRGISDAVPRLRPGEGLIGSVAADGRARLVTPETTGRRPATGGLSAGGLSTGGPGPAPGEPVGRFQVLVPLVGRGAVFGVLTLYRDHAGADPFDERDLETLQSFAAQAAVAVENVVLHEEAQRGSVTDPLTGLWNFRHFDTEARRELESAARFGRPLSLLLLDVDHFKRVNDEHGHQAGDEVLRELARRVRETARSPDVVARYGGEEFVVLLPGADADGARVSAERMRQRVAGTPVDVGGGIPRLTISCSVGVASYPAHADDLSDLITRADEALYEAKNAGRDRVAVARAVDVEVRTA